MTNPFDREEYPTYEPLCLVLGKFSAWKLPLSYDNISFSIKYVLNEVSGDTEVVIDGTLVQLTDKEYWVFEIPSNTSTAWAFDKDTGCRWDLVLTNISSSDEIILQSGFINIFESTSDRRTHAEIMLGKINSILEGKADNDVSSYSIKSRSISKMTVEELMMWRDYYVNEITRTGGSVQTDEGTPKTNTVRVRFK